MAKATKREIDRCPLRVEEIPTAALEEWRVDQTKPPRLCESWQLVYVRNGMIEELCDTRWVVLRRGALLLHQPNEQYAMRIPATVPPEVLRVDFVCRGQAMDLFRGRATRTSSEERACLRQMLLSLSDWFEPPAAPGEPPALRPDPPFGAMQLLMTDLERLLILLTRRLQRPRRPSPRVQAEQNQTALVEAVRLYFAQNLEVPVTLAETCRVNECDRMRLQSAFRARTRCNPMQYYARMRLEYASQLMAQGYRPGQVAEMLHYSSTAYFSKCFHVATGMTPTAYCRKPQPLHLCNK